MPYFEVTTAQTAYETYLVSASDAEAAKARVLDGEYRAYATSWPSGDNDDLEVIDVSGPREIPAPMLQPFPVTARQERRLI